MVHRRQALVAVCCCCCWCCLLLLLAFVVAALLLPASLVPAADAGALPRAMANLMRESILTLRAELSPREIRMRHVLRHDFFSCTILISTPTGAPTTNNLPPHSLSRQNQYLSSAFPQKISSRDDTADSIVIVIVCRSSSVIVIVIASSSPPSSSSSLHVDVEGRRSGSGSRRLCL